MKTFTETTIFIHEDKYESVSKNPESLSLKLKLKLIKLIIHSKYFPNSGWLKAHAYPVTDDQIWMDFVFNEEMASKVQPVTG